MTEEEFKKQWDKTFEVWNYQMQDEIQHKHIDSENVKEAFKDAENADFKKDNWDLIENEIEDLAFEITDEIIEFLNDGWSSMLESYANWLEQKYEYEKPTAQEPISLDNAVILDTETTGLGRTDEIVQIAIIDAITGEKLLNEFVKPIKSIPNEASDIHHITNEMVEHCPSYKDIHNDILNIIKDKNVIVYNSDFDLRIINQTAAKHRLISNPNNGIEFKDTVCVMEWYSEFWGDFNDYFNSYTWQKLTSAAAQQNIDISDLTAHNALADCEITRRLINSVNKKLSE